MRLLGVHIIGSNACELIHTGQAYLRMNATADQMANQIFNYPSLSDLYRHAALEALAPCQVEPPTVVSLAKQEETVFVAGLDEPLRLSRTSAALKLVQYVRDEAHRFAQHYHHILRRKSTLGD